MTAKLEAVAPNDVQDHCYVCMLEPSEDPSPRRWFAHQQHVGTEKKLVHFIHQTCHFQLLNPFNCNICKAGVNPHSLLSFPERIKYFISDHSAEFLKTALGIGAIAGMYFMAPTISDIAIRHGVLVYDYFNSIIRTPLQVVPHTYQLITSMDLSVSATISYIAFYNFTCIIGDEIGHFHDSLCAGRHPYLTRAAIQLGICGPEMVFYRSCNTGNVASCKTALKILLQRGIPDRQIGHLLGHAIKHQQEEDIIDSLIDYGAPLNLSGPPGFVSRENYFLGHCEPALLTACRSKCSLRIIQKLVGHGADFTEKDNEGNNVLHLFCHQNRGGRNWRKSDLAILEYLLSLPGIKEKINARNHAGETSLFRLRTDCIPARDLLVENGADFTISTNEGHTLLDKACSHSDSESIRFYVEKGLTFSLAKRFQPGSIIRSPETNLFARMCYSDIKHLINEKILDLFYIDPQTGDSLLHLAVRRDPPLFVNFFCKKISSSDKNPLATLKNNDGKTVIQLLIEICRNEEDEYWRRKHQKYIRTLCSKAGFIIVDSDIQAAEGDPNLERILLDLKESYKKRYDEE